MIDWLARWIVRNINLITVYILCLAHGLHLPLAQTLPLMYHTIIIYSGNVNDWLDANDLLGIVQFRVMIEDETTSSENNEAAENLVQAVSSGAACDCANMKD